MWQNYSNDSTTFIPATTNKIAVTVTVTVTTGHSITADKQQQ